MFNGVLHPFSGVFEPNASMDVQENLSAAAPADENQSLAAEQVMGLCPIGPLGQRTLSGTGPFSPLVGQRLCAVGAATEALGRCALEKGHR